MKDHKNIKLHSASLRLRARSGFTLLEILIAITMIGLILGTLLGVFTGMMSSSSDASKKAEVYQTGRALMDLICADIRGFIPLSEAEGKVFFKGVTATSPDDEEVTRMDFVTTHSLPIGIARNPFLSEVGYKVTKNQDNPLYSLWRRSEYPPIPPYQEGGSEIPVCRNVENFRLEFVGNNGTKHNLTDGVPEAVVVSLTLKMDGEREEFVTMVRSVVRP
jgi:prepilin-type N-terminal cleavage/methylation domain-containing protein